MAKSKPKTIRSLSVTKKIGGWVEMTFTKKKMYRGIWWYRTCFGDRNDREDWVADISEICMSVSRYVGQKDWGISSMDKADTFEAAADEQIARAKNKVVYLIKEAESRLKKAFEAQTTLALTDHKHG